MTNPETSIEQEVTVLQPDIDFDSLLKVLVNGNVPVETFGTGAAKTVGHLLKEIQEGESIVTVNPNGFVQRYVDVLWVDVFCVLDSGDVYILREDRQVFKDGRDNPTKRRSLPSSIGEKLKPGENGDNAVRRAIEEELGVSDVDSIQAMGHTQDKRVPEAFPGIETFYNYFQYATTIPANAFNSEGYVEDQPDKTNYYEWDLLYRAS